MTELYISTITKLNFLVQKGDISAFQPLDMAHFSSNQSNFIWQYTINLKSRPLRVPHFKNIIKLLLQNQNVCLNIDRSVGTHRTAEVQFPAGTYISVCSTKCGPAASPTLTPSQGITRASFLGVSGWGEGGVWIWPVTSFWFRSSESMERLPSCHHTFLWCVA